MVAVRVVALPVPGVRAHVVERLGGGPAEDFLCLCGVGVNRGEIARAARCDDVSQIAPAGFGVGFDHFQNGNAVARTEVENLCSFVVHHIVQRGNMSGSKVDHMQVVAYTGTVRSVVIIAMNGIRLFGIPCGSSPISPEG